MCGGQRASQATLVVKNPPASARNNSDVDSIPESERSLEEGMATLSSIPAWRIPMDRRPWWAAVHRVTLSQTWLKWLSMHTRYTTSVFRNLWIIFIWPNQGSIFIIFQILNKICFLGLHFYPFAKYLYIVPNFCHLALSNIYIIPYNCCLSI